MQVFIEPTEDEGATVKKLKEEKKSEKANKKPDINDLKKKFLKKK